MHVMKAKTVEITVIVQDINDAVFSVLLVNSILCWFCLLSVSVQSRLAVNSVILGDFNRPLQLHSFLMDLNAGFRLLNLKNDALRKRFDGLKYDVKKVEEVVYDISIRKLNDQ